MPDNALNTNDIVTLTTEYSTPYNAVLRDNVVMGVTRYFLERWVPFLGPGPAAVVNTLRQLDYRCSGDTITISGAALAHEAAMSRRYLYTCLDSDWIRAFVQRNSGQHHQTASGKIIQESNHYRIRMDDPLTPADADRAVEILTNLADTPIEAAQRALELEARDLWAADPTQTGERFTNPHALTALDVLKRAFPTWSPATPPQQEAFLQAAEQLHRHSTLVREDGRASKIIVPQYFRKRWWNRLGHDLAWSYLWLRGNVYNNPDEGIRRNLCWIPSLNTLLTLTGRSREWWRRHVENEEERDEDWSITNFFQQIQTQKGRDPEHPQWVARQFQVALEIPIAPEDRERYNELLANWTTTPEEPEAEQPASPVESVTDMHTGQEEVCHKHTHRIPRGLPQTYTPDSEGSATDTHTDEEGVCHKHTQGTATFAHSKAESKEKATEKKPEHNSSSSNQSEPLPENSEGVENNMPEPAAAETENQEIPNENLSLLEQFVATLKTAPETPLCLAATVTAWLRDIWISPVRPHTPAWTICLSGKVSPRDLVALNLVIWADSSVQHPARYLSWLLQRWHKTPEIPPVDRWEQWRALAEMSIKDWLEKGQQIWVEVAPRDNRALPFEMGKLLDQFDQNRF